MQEFAVECKKDVLRRLLEVGDDFAFGRPFRVGDGVV